MNEHVATQFSNIENLMYNGEHVILAQERGYDGPKNGKSEIVKVSNLPLNFQEVGIIFYEPISYVLLKRKCNHLHYICFFICCFF